ncbi:MAG TPA: hypothetical protein VFA45_15810 [Actinomycetes bacterium]|jgi:hypothetical protein|nr:hypothetical protein [Actinomycetes bacterium]
MDARLHPHSWPWRWLVLLVAVALVVALPALVSALPVSTRALPAAELLARVQASTAVPYQGYAESRASLGVPDLPTVQRMAALLGGITRMRAWVAGPVDWRVDELSTIGERDLYHDASGTLEWDSGTRRVERTFGEPVARFARPADLLPPELGRRLAAAATPGEVRSLPARRVAGVEAAGLRISPRSKDTTVGLVHLWADPTSGLPVRVELTARGGSGPIIVTTFLDLRQQRPSQQQVRFQEPPDASVDVEEAPDLARAVERFSPFVLPERVGGEPRRNRLAGAASTYGERFDLVAVLAFPARITRRTRDFLESLPSRTGPWGEARVIVTPLLSSMVFQRDYVVFALSGTVGLPVLERIASDLASHGVALR